MQIKKGSTLYEMWRFTFNDCHQPCWTTKLRFWLRIVLLFVPIFVAIVVTLIVGFVVGNLYTILSGRGVIVGWDDGEPLRVREFDDLVVANAFIPTRVIAEIFWICVATLFFWQQYPAEFIAYGYPVFAAAVAIVIFVVVVFAGVIFADWREHEGEIRINRLFVKADIENKPLPPDIVTFVDSSSDIAEET